MQFIKTNFGHNGLADQSNENVTVLLTKIPSQCFSASRSLNSMVVKFSVRILRHIFHCVHFLY